MSTFRVGDGSVALVPNAAGFHSKARRDLKAMNLNAGVDLRPTGGRFRQEARDRLKSVNLAHDVKLRVDATGFKADAETKLAARPLKVNVTPTVDEAAWRAFETDARLRLSRMDLRVSVRPDIDEAAYREVQARLRALAQNQTSTITTHHNNVGGNGGDGGGVGGLTKSAGKIGLMASAVAALGGAIGIAGGALGGLAVAGAGVGIAFGAMAGTIALGMDGIKEAAATAQPAFDELKASVSSVFASEMQAGFASLSTLMGSITPQMKEIASATSGLFNGIAASLVSVAPQLQTALGGVANMVSALGPGLNSMFKSFAAFGANIAPFMSQIGASLGTIAATIGHVFASLDPSFFAGLVSFLQSLSPLIYGLLTALTTMASQVMPALMPLFSALGKALVTIAEPLGALGAAFATALAPVLPVLADLISALANALAPLLPPLSAVLQTVGTALTGLVQGLAPAIGPLGEAFSALITATAPLLPLVGEITGQLLGALAPVLTTIFEAFAPVIAQLVEALQPALEQLIPIIAQIASTIGDYWVSMLNMLAPLLPEIVGAIGELLGALLPLVPPLLEVAEQLFPSLVQIVGALLPVIVQVIGILTQLVGVIMPILIPAIQLLGAIVGAVFSAAATAIQWAVDNVISPALQWFSDRITDAKSIVGGAVDWIVDKWNTAVDFFKGLPGRIGDALSGMWDGLKDGFRSALNWLIEKWNNFGLHWSFTIPVINKTVNFDVDTPDLPMFASGGRVPMLPGAVAGKDSILAGIMPGEYITPTKRVTPQTLPLLEAIRAGWTPSAQFLDSMFNAMPGFADGGGYGLPTGTSIGYGGSGFPDWVNKLAAAHGVQPSTYPGHQESDRNESGYAPNPQHLNRGIDFSGSVEAMQGFAEALMGQAPSNTAIEQIIWQNPSTGQQLGWHGRQKDDGSYFAADYSGHQDHVHLRASGPVGEGIGTSPDTAMDGAQTASSGLGSQFTGKTSGKLTAEYEQGVPTLDEAMKDKTLDKVFVVNMPSSFNFAADTTGSTSSGSTSSGSSTSTSSTTSSAPSTVDTIPLKKNDDGTYSSTDPEWDHLIQRESGGKADIVQQVQDANSGGNEASGLFQIAKGTWDANGGTKYAPTAGQATPEQQAEIAAAIFNDQGGAPWGSGLAGRENDDKLRAGIQRKGAAPAGTPTDPVAVTTTPDSTTTIDTPSTPDTAATTTPESTPADESMLTRWMREQFEAVVGKPTTTAQATTTASLSKDDELALTVGQSFADHTPLGIGSGQFALAKSKAPAVTEIGAGIAKALPAWGQALAGDPAALIANVGGATAAWGAKTATDFAAYLPEAAGGMFESLASAVAGPLIGTVNTGMSQDQLVSTVEDVQNRQLRRSKTGRRRY